jgi:DNA mismatch repair protein MutS2
LSTFASHITNIRSMAGAVEATDLVLIDEIGTGTDPVEGEALAKAMAEYFLKSGAFTIITTHFSGLKIYASQVEGAVNASVEFDEATLRPTYRLIGGVAGASSGIEIAARLGLQQEIVAQARGHLSEAQTSMIEFLNQLKKEKEQYEIGQEQLRVEVENVRQERVKQREEFARQRDARAAGMDRRFATFLTQLEARAQKSLDAIQESTARIRAKREMEHEFKRLKDRAAAQMKAVLSEVGNTPTELFTEEDEDNSSHVFRVGERVNVRPFNKEALIHRIAPDGAAEVLVGSFKMKVALSDCRPVGLPSDIPKVNPLADLAKGDSRLKIEARPAATSELNLIGCSVEEALGSADKFLDQAFLADVPRVRIIHGSGMGVLRRSLAEMFSKHPQVERFYLAPREQGGNGVTIVELKV